MRLATEDVPRILVKRPWPRYFGGRGADSSAGVAREVCAYGEYIRSTPDEKLKLRMCGLPGG